MDDSERQIHSRSHQPRGSGSWGGLGGCIVCVCVSKKARGWFTCLLCQSTTISQLLSSHSPRWYLFFILLKQLYSGFEEVGALLRRLAAGVISSVICASVTCCFSGFSFVSDLMGLSSCCKTSITPHSLTNSFYHFSVWFTFTKQVCECL